MTEREAELVAALESVLADARYAIGQVQRVRRGCPMEGLDRAIDALERIECNATAALVGTAEVEVVE
jgi:hypothetical protein